MVRRVERLGGGNEIVGEMCLLRHLPWCETKTTGRMKARRVSPDRAERCEKLRGGCWQCAVGIAMRAKLVQGSVKRKCDDIAMVTLLLL